MPTVVVGSDPSELNGLVVTSGAPGLAGQAALFGRTLDRETYEAGLDDVTVDSKMRSEMVIPVVVEGTTESLVCLNRFGETGYDEDTMAFADTLALVLGAGMSNVATLQHKDRQVQEAVEDKMAAEAKASFLKQAFSRTVAPAVVEKILSSPEEFRTGGERRILTVFYSDIRSFTSLSEKVTADGMVGLLNDYFEAMARLVFKHEGTIDKWIGDAVMAFFGAPHEQPDHARRAIAMSIEMQQTLLRLNEGWHASGRFAELGVPDYPGLKIGIGLHSGEANVGFLGAKSSRVDYTAIGDTVNTAARLVSKAAAGEIVISRATVEAAGVGFRFEELEPMMLKGKAEPVSTFKVLY